MNTFNRGDLVRVSGTITDTSGSSIDPAAVFFVLRTPDGSEIEYLYGREADLKREEAGRYYIDIDCALAGTYYYRFYSTGAGQGAAEGAFKVERGAFA